MYLNTISVLEGSEEKYKLEVSNAAISSKLILIFLIFLLNSYTLLQNDNQKVTISNLQSAFISLKQELDSFKQKSDENVSLSWTARWFGHSTAKPQNSNEKIVHDV